MHLAHFSFIGLHEGQELARRIGTVGGGAPGVELHDAGGGEPAWPCRAQPGRLLLRHVDVRVEGVLRGAGARPISTS